MRKYEEGGGVVPFRWRAGSPSANLHNTALVEVWTITFDWQGEPCVNARIRVAFYNRNANSWESRDGHPIAGDGKIKRWAPVGDSRTAYPSLTLTDWPNA